MQQHRDEPLISVAEAARRLGLNRSTLSRQIRKGAIRSHEGKVRFSEVKEDRERNLYPGRAGRHSGERDFVTRKASDATIRSASVASRDRGVIDNPVAAAVVQLLGRCQPVVVDAAIKAGCSAKVAYALASGIQYGLNQVGNEVLRADGGPGFERASDTLVIEDDLFHEPDWSAIAARIGEPVDFNAWFDWTEERGL